MNVLAGAAVIWGGGVKGNSTFWRSNLQGLQTEWGGGEIKGLLPPVEDEVNRYFGGTLVGENKQTDVTLRLRLLPHI